jgi:cytochrome c oxidase subunit 2
MPERLANRLSCGHEWCLGRHRRRDWTRRLAGSHLLNVNEGIQSALHPQGPQAVAIAEIAWMLFVGAAVIFVLVAALVGWAAFGRTRGWLAGERAVVAGGILLPGGVLTALLIHTLLVAGRLDAAAAEPDLRIEVVGEQWWWRVRYLDDAGNVDFVTANEIRVPVGSSVELRLRSADVLHSLWIPALAGKLDMIPGKDNRLRVEASRAGVFRGQCAEYCGGPHAQMALFVVAAEAPEFLHWRESQRAPAAGGSALFLSHCAACHTVRGTAAAGVLGPDLTHVGSRLSIGAGILPNDVGTIAGWIASSQHLKPGNLMPAFRDFAGEELNALAHYVASLR